MMNSHQLIGFSSTLDEDDYGIIISKEGRVKGVWIPKGKEDEVIPIAVVNLCEQSFGINPNTDEYISQTIH
jgi:hypothetical protein